MLHISTGSRRSMLVPVAAVVALSAWVGCGSGEKITTYNVPKDSAPPVVNTLPATPGEPTDRMLAAIVPENGQAWIYKVVGPISAVDAQADEILSFVASVPPANGASAPAWKLPAGWTSQPGSDGFTLATIKIPNGGKPLDLTVSSLGWSAPNEMLLMNVNRWRGQMGLPARGAADDVSQDTRTMPAGERTMTIVDLQGAFRRGGMGGPFSGGAMSGGMPSSSASGASPPSAGGLPADHPPIGADSTKAPSNASDKKSASSGSTTTVDVMSQASSAPVPKFTAPASWSPMSAGGMIRSAFRVAEDGQEAVISVSNLPTSAGASFADPLQNANMWRGGVGLPEIEREQLPDATETIDIGGNQATLVRAIPGEDQPEATLGAVVSHGDQIWFFKIKGARQLVTKHEPEFLAFLKSIQFANQ